MGVILGIIGIGLLLSVLGWAGKLLEFLFGIFSEGLGNCLGCVVKLAVWGLIFLLALVALGLL